MRMRACHGGGGRQRGEGRREGERERDDSGGSKVNLKQQKQGSVTFPLATLK